MKVIVLWIISTCLSQFINTQSTFCTTRYDCSNYTRYRSIDGSCNNLIKPWLGKTATPLKRMLPSAYNDLKRYLRSKSVNGSDLPNPRSIALAVHYPAETPGKITLFGVFFGQMIAHDVVLSGSATNNGATIDCSTDVDNAECINIKIPPEDTLNKDEKLITATRTASTNTNSDCLVTNREPLNQLTSWLDLSVIYGSDQATSDSLRTKTDGLLKTQQIPGFSRSFMMQAPNGSCVQETATRKCFRSGEFRPNENSVISSIQTLFVREHNRLAGIIKRLKPTFTDEQLFQETRRIVIAEYQHIIYNEWLPSIIGRNLASLYNLLPKPGKFSSYDPRINATLYNEFGTAAFRFGHSLVKSSYAKKNVGYNTVKIVPLLNITLNPNEAYQDEGLDGLCRGAITERSSSFDSHLTDSVQNHLFEVFGINRVTIRSSLSALNINRGRDHGIQPYVKYREYCGFPKAYSFDDLKEIPESVLNDTKKAYGSHEDIDLFTGGISEKPIPDGTVGPTFACIIGKQFKDFKFGDRFYYEYSLNDKELNEIKNVTIARIICDNLDVSSIPKNAFLPSDSYLSCSEIQSMKYEEVMGIAAQPNPNPPPPVAPNPPPPPRPPAPPAPPVQQPPPSRI